MAALHHTCSWKMTLLASFLLCSVLFYLGQGRPQAPACKFSIPATNATGSCDVYDLSQIAAAGAMTYEYANSTYTFSLCENVPSSSVPEACKSAGQGVAYQYDEKAKKCYNIGKLDSTSVVRRSMHAHAFLLSGMPGGIYAFNFNTQYILSSFL